MEIYIMAIVGIIVICVVPGIVARHIYGKMMPDDRNKRQ